MGLLGQYAGRNLNDIPLNKQQAGGLLGVVRDAIKQKAEYAAGLLDPNSQVSQDARAWHKRTQAGLGDLLAGKSTPDADYGYSQLMNMVGVAPLGMTVWHGSPHKFDKFDMSKIGTGEGAQAYGHGLYVAESPDVAKSYLNPAGRTKIEIDGGNAIEAAYKDKTLGPAVRYLQDYGDTEQAIKYAKDYGDLSVAAKIQELKDAGRLGKPEGTFYKVDIPDEAVARFLDWDKPLSEQAQINDLLRQIDWHARGEATTGRDIYGRMADSLGGEDAAAKELAKAGIPGIRYLDGGSRGTGQGTSNFVLFDDQLPRILEINGQATGNQPWKPGEWQGLLGDAPKTVEGPRAEAMRSSRTQAPIGGTDQTTNGYFYKGGQFLPSTDAEPGKWKVGKKWITSGKELVGPGEYAVQPTPFSRSIFDMMRGYLGDVGNGSAAFRTDLNPEYFRPDMKIRPGVKGVLGKEEISYQELLDAYNKGQRWFDVAPDAATITTKQDGYVDPRLLGLIAGGGLLGLGAYSGD